MTTIAFRDGILAADSGVFAGDAVLGSTIKIVKNHRGWIGGAAGRLADTAVFYKWFTDGCGSDVPALSADNAQAIVIGRNGIVSFVGDGATFAYDAPFYAIGAGYQFALGAMQVGATAVEAVQAAIALNTDTVGPVTFLELESLV